MNIAKLVFAFVRRKPLTWAFHVLTLTLGVGVVVAVILLSQALDNRFNRDIAGVDLVVGAKGSPLQLIMSSLFEIDIPTGNIPLSVAERIEHHPLVRIAVPVSLGDNVHGLRIVGTTPAYANLYGANLDHGRWWNAPLQVVLGADAARILHLDIGGVFVGQHGLAAGGEFHAQFPYRVVGILKPTGAVIDRLALTDTESVWRIHEHEAAEEAAEQGLEAAPAHQREVTAVLVRYKGALGAIVLPQLVRAIPDAQAAVPALEAARLNQLLGAGADVLRWFGVGLLGLSAIGFFIALFAAVQQRQRELALLRVLGAGGGLLLSVILLEAVVLGMLGGALGIGLGRVVGALAAQAAGAHGGPSLPLPPWGPVEAIALAAALGLSIATALAPSILAARIDPAETLKSG
jgi:putative ABC transport system permease protein